MKGLEETYRVLAQTKNESATDLLAPRLSISDESVVSAALATLLRRRSPRAHREVLRCLQKLPRSALSTLGQFPGKMTSALRDAILGDDERMRTNALNVVSWLHEYDLVPALVILAEDSGHPASEWAADIVLVLCERLRGEVEGSAPAHGGRDLRKVRQELLPSLQESIARFETHQSQPLMESFLLIAGPENSLLRELLNDPLAASHQGLVQLLSKTERPGVLDLLFDLAKSDRAPVGALHVLSRRTDMTFLRKLHNRLTGHAGPALRRNLRKLDHVEWIRVKSLQLDMLVGEEQAGLVQLAMATGVARERLLEFLKHMLIHGQAAGRLGAMEALAQFHGEQANQLAERALADESPQVRAEAARQVRPRGIHGGLAKLIALLHDDVPIVQQAVRESLQEFSFDRFVQTFEVLSPALRKATGGLVWQVDPTASRRLRESLEALPQKIRCRAIEIIVAMGVEQEFEDALIVCLLQDEDHFVRLLAARALGSCHTLASQETLLSACRDRSYLVQDAARESLRQHVHDVSATPEQESDSPLQQNLATSNEGGS